MVMLVHLAPEKAARAISRGGIKVSKRFRNKPNGVFAMPVTRRLVEPVRAALRFDPAARSLEAATVLFGAHRSTQAQRGHRTAARLRRDVLAGALGARPKRPFAWRHRFTLKRNAWSHEAL